jgi:hypothetical protein
MRVAGGPGDDLVEVLVRGMEGIEVARPVGGALAGEVGPELGGRRRMPRIASRRAAWMRAEAGMARRPEPSAAERIGAFMAPSCRLS